MKESNFCQCETLRHQVEQLQHLLEWEKRKADYQIRENALRTYDGIHERFATAITQISKMVATLKTVRTSCRVGHRGLIDGTIAEVKEALTNEINPR